MQIINLTPSQPIITGLLNSEDVMVLCDTSLDSFSISVPVAQSTKQRKISFKNVGINIVTLMFNSNSPLQYYDTYATTLLIPSGKCVETFSDNINNKWYLIGRDYDRFGGQVNYSQFESDGTLKFYGDATVFEDLNFDPASSGGPAATIPDYVTIDNVIYREFTSANNQYCGSAQEITHASKLGATHKGHCHVFLKSGESAGTTGVTFTCYWALRSSLGVTSGSFTLSATSAQLTACPYKCDIYDLVGFSGGLELGAQMALRIGRTGGNAGDVIVLTYGIHYEIDSVGSREIAAK